MHDQDLVDKIFRVGIPTLMYGFNPWKLPEFVNAIHTKPLWILLINTELTDDLKIYAKNWQRVIKTFFTWDSVEYPDPVDQCVAISRSAVKIQKMLFEGIKIDKVKRKDPAFFNLWYGNSKFVDSICRKIVKWSTTHKFIDEMAETIMDENEEG